MVISKKIHDELGLATGDYLEVAVADGNVVFTPKTLVDRRIEKRIAEGIDDIKKGRVDGPFDSAKEFVHSLHARKKPKKA